MNPQSGDCTSGSYYDTCYVQVGTIDDTDTIIDSGSAGYTVEGLPSMTFSVSGVTSGTVTNGVMTTATSTYNTLPFGELIPLQASFVAQQLNVVTNAPDAYNVYMKVTSQLQGVYTSATVTPFDASSASWSSPQVWADRQEQPQGLIQHG